MGRKALVGWTMLASVWLSAGSALAQVGASGSGTSPTQVGGTSPPSGPDAGSISAAPTKATVPSATAQNGASLSEIIVTARRVTENLQTTPVSVTAITAGQLARLGAVNVADLSKITPNLTVTSYVGNPSAALLEIRGQVTNDNLITLDPAVGVYINDVYFARAYSDLTDLLDVADVEVLKGPQGTLYGRNTIGGAVKVTTQQPKTTDDIGGFLTLGGGNYSTFTAAGAVTLPLIKDVLAVRLAASHIQHDGYTNSYLVDQPSLVPVERIGSDNKDSTSLRATFVFTPIKNLKATLISSYYIDKTHGSLDVNQNGDVSDINGPGYTNEFNSVQRSNNFYSALTNIKPIANTRSTSDILTLDYKISAHLANKIILGYVDTASVAQEDSGGVVTDSVALLDFATSLTETQHQFSAEDQIYGDALDGRLNFIGGAYYFVEQGGEITNPQNFELIFGQPENVLFNGFAHNESKSVYFNGGYKLTPRLTINGGLRYTNDTKSIDAHTTINNTCVYTAGSGIVTSTTPGGPCSLSRVDNFYNLSFEADASYRITDQIFAYAKASDGYRSGGEQLRALSTASAAPFQADKVMSYEAGLKNELFDRRLRLNLAYFHTNFSNAQQSEILSPGASPDPTIPTTTTVIVNAGSAEADGFELETVGRVTDHFTVAANVGYTDFRFADPTLRPTFTPPFKESLSLTYDQPFGWGSLDPSLNFSHSDHQYVALQRSEYSELQPINLLDGRVTANLPHGLSLSAYAKNITGQEYYVGGIVSANTFGSYVGAPRTYGVEATYRF